MLNWLGPYTFAGINTLVMALVVVSSGVLFRAGLFAIPNVGFMAIGAYASGVLALKVGLPFPLDLLGGVVAAAIVGRCLGEAVRRLSGIQLAIATIAFSEIVVEVITNLGITGGAIGLVDIPVSTAAWQVILAVGACVAGGYYLQRTRYGRGVDAMRQDPLVAAHSGLSIGACRATLFTLSGAVAGLGGGFYASLQGFLQPSQFTLSLMLQVVAALILGGMLSPVGPVIGAILIFGVPVLWTGGVEVENIAFGVIIVLVIALEPAGLAGLGWRLAGRVRRLARYRARSTIGGPALAVDGDPRTRNPSSPQTREAAAPPRGRVPGGESGLVVNGLSVAFGGVMAVDELSIVVRKGEFLGLIGPNGSGKTTFLNAISGVVRPTAGSIVFEGGSVSSGRPDRVAAMGIARTFQGIRLLADWSVIDNVEIGGYLNVDPQQAGSGPRGPHAGGRRWRSRQRTRALELLEGLGLTGELVDRPVSALSYGVQRRVEIARALMMRPRLILLDEPAAGMTENESREIFELARGLTQTGMSVIAVEHDVGMITTFSDHVAVLDFGRRIAYGTPQEVLTDTRVVEAYLGRSA